MLNNKRESVIYVTRHFLARYDSANATYIVADEKLSLQQTDAQTAEIKLKVSSKLLTHNHPH